MRRVPTGFAVAGTLMMTSLENVLTLGIVQDGAGDGLPADLGTSQGDPSGNNSSATNPNQGTGTSSGMNPLFLLAPFLLIMILMTTMGGRREKKQRATLMSSLKKRDRVQTQGGIIGVIVEMKDDEVLLKVDEGSNTKIRFAKSAVQRVLRSTATSSADEESVVEEASVS